VGVWGVGLPLAAIFPWIGGGFLHGGGFLYGCDRIQL
jgi:hypothetical protein